MNKNLQTGLILVGVIAAMLVLAFVAQAAGLNSPTARMPYGGAMGQYGAGMMANMQGAQAGMMGGTQGGNMMGGTQGGYMMNPDQMPHGDGQQDCPYFQEQ